jgi:hypothetical protein
VSSSTAGTRALAPLGTSDFLDQGGDQCSQVGVVGDRVPRHLDAAVAAEQAEHECVGIGRSGVRRRPVVAEDVGGPVCVGGDAGPQPVVVGVRGDVDEQRVAVRAGEDLLVAERHPVVEEVRPLRLLPRELVDRQPVAGPGDGERRRVDPVARLRVDARLSSRPKSRTTTSPTPWAPAGTPAAIPASHCTRA